MAWMTQGNVCPGLFYGTPAQDGFLIRLRLPGGIIEPPLSSALAWEHRYNEIQLSAQGLMKH